MANPVVHWEIGGRDIAKLEGFYAKLFGWNINTENPEYGMVDPGGDGAVGGGIMKMPEGIPPYVTIYVHVDDLEASLAKAGELGGVMIKPPAPIPGVGSFALFQDPEGNVIGLLSD